MVIMKKTIDSFFTLEQYLCGYLLFQIMTVIFVATVCRYTKLVAFSWGEELARFSLVWLVFVGSGLGSYQGLHFNVDVIVNKFPLKVQKICLIIRMAIIYAFCLFVMYYGHFVVRKQFTSGQLSATLGIPMWFMYSSVPVGCFLIILHYTGYAKKLYREIQNKIDGKISNDRTTVDIDKLLEKVD